MLNYIDFARKCFFVLKRILNFKISDNLIAIYHFKSTNLLIGKRVRIHGIANNIHVGRKTIISDHCVFEFGSGCLFNVGANCYFSYGIVISCNKSIVIGNDVQIGEYTSIRDTTHDYNNYGLPMKYNKDISTPITVGNNVWIGRGCIILPGTIIEDGVVVGANSVVKGILKSNSIYAGSPLKLIRTI